MFVCLGMTRNTLILLLGNNKHFKMSLYIKVYGGIKGVQAHGQRAINI